MKSGIGIVVMMAMALIMGCCTCQQREENSGGWRWEIKTLADYNPQLTEPETTTVKFEANKQRPEYFRIRDTSETHKYIIKCKLVSYSRERDSDFHIIVKDSDRSRYTMIVEIPWDSVCPATPTKFRNDFKNARDSFLTILTKHGLQYPKLGETIEPDKNDPVYFVITGVGFWDREDHATGEAPNGRELHPVLRIEETK